MFPSIQTIYLHINEDFQPKSQIITKNICLHNNFGRSVRSRTDYYFLRYRLVIVCVAWVVSNYICLLQIEKCEVDRFLWPVMRRIGFWAQILAQILPKFVPKWPKIFGKVLSCVSWLVSIHICVLQIERKLSLLVLLPLFLKKRNLGSNFGPNSVL